MQRPTSILVFGILNIVFGVLGFCGLGFSALVIFGSGLPMPAGQNNPVLKLMRDNPSYKTFMVISFYIGGGAVIALLVAGIGLLMSQPWARTLSIIYGWFAIVNGIVGAFVNITVVTPAMLKESGASGGPQAVGAAFGAIFTIIGGILGLIFPVLLLIFMYRANVVAFFAATRQPQDEWQMIPPTR